MSDLSAKKVQAQLRANIREQRRSSYPTESEPPKKGWKIGAARTLIDDSWRLCPVRNLPKDVNICLDTFWWFLIVFDVAPFRWPLLQSADTIVEHMARHAPNRWGPHCVNPSTNKRRAKNVWNRKPHFCTEGPLLLWGRVLSAHLVRCPSCGSSRQTWLIWVHPEYLMRHNEDISTSMLTSH